ncbi:MAG: response regulator transcription factor [Chloroflexota bacterium]
MDKIQVVIAEDHHVVRAALVSFLAREADLEVVGEVADATTLVETIGRLRPHVLLLDAHMPGHRVLPTAQRLRTLYPAVRILVLSAYARREYIVGLLKAGAAGYILKDDPQETLILGIRSVAQGRRWLSARVMDVLVKSAEQPPEEPAEELTKREVEVLRLMAQGYRNNQIAETLHVTEQTVKNYIRNIFLKLGVETRVEAVLRAIHTGLVSEGD